MDGFQDSYVRDCLGYIHRVFDSEIKVPHKEQFAKVVIVSPSLDNPIVVSGRFLNELDLEGQDVFDKIAAVVQSGNDLKLEDAEIMIGLLDMDKGTGFTKRCHPTTTMSVESAKRNVDLKRSTVAIKNTDQHCMMTAIAVSWCKKISVAMMGGTCV